MADNRNSRVHGAGLDETGTDVIDRFTDSIPACTFFWYSQGDNEKLSTIVVHVWFCRNEFFLWHSSRLKFGFIDHIDWVKEPLSAIHSLKMHAVVVVTTQTNDWRRLRQYTSNLGHVRVAVWWSFGLISKLHASLKRHARAATVLPLQQLYTNLIYLNVWLVIMGRDHATPVPCTMWEMTQLYVRLLKQGALRRIRADSSICYNS